MPAKYWWTYKPIKICVKRSSQPGNSSRDDKNYKFDFFCNAEPFVTHDEFLKTNLKKAVKKIVKIDPEESTSGGTSDARFITKICPVIEFGLVGKTMHKVDENVLVNDIKKLTNIYNEFLINYFGLRSSD